MTLNLQTISLIFSGLSCIPKPVDAGTDDFVGHL